MKKSAYIILAACFAAVTLSCSKKEIEPQFAEGANSMEDGEKTLVEFTATATAANTRTDIDNGNTVWSANDQITVFFDGGGSATADIKVGEGTNHATYEVAVPASTNYYAVYPASVSSSLTDTDKIRVTLPSSQNGSFGCAHIAVAKAVEKTFTFANINAFLKITLPEGGYTRIVVESPDGSALAGEADITLGGETPGIAIGSTTYSTVEISSAGYEAGNVYISVLPGVTHNKGLLLKYYNGSELKGSYYLDKAVTTEVSTIHSFGDFGVSGHLYATVAGAGNKSGINLANAMDAQALKNYLSLPEDASELAARIAALSDLTIHMGAGTYNFDNYINLDFPSASANVKIDFVGNTPDEEDATSWTIITGAEAHRLLILGKKANASFTNISFEKGRGVKAKESPLYAKSGSTGHFVGCRFLDNINQKTDGSYLTCGCFYAETGTTLSFNHCEWAGCKGSWGGTLVPYGNTTLSNCVFHDNNSYSGPGAAIYIDDSNAICNLEHCSIKANKVNAYDGGALCVCAGTITLTSCQLVDNSCEKKGGALRLYNSAKGTLINCTVNTNNGTYGGAIHLDNDAILEIQGGSYESNIADGGGCICASKNSTLTISGNAYFKGNNCKKGHGGCILAEKDCKFTCTDVTFEENFHNNTGTGGVYGGAIGFLSDNIVANINRCVFRGNYTLSSGGAAINHQDNEGASGSLTVKNTLFENNCNHVAGSMSGDYGRQCGAVRLGSDKASFLFEDCIFRGNGTKCVDIGTEGLYGGAVCYYSDLGGTFNRCTFEGNYATKGGAISCRKSAGKLYLNACSFSGNYCSNTYGSTIHVVNCGSFCMNNCSFNDNSYTTTGSTSLGAGTWVLLENCKNHCIVSNCSLIGSARGENLIARGSDDCLLYFCDSMTEGSAAPYHLFNSIVVAESNGLYYMMHGDVTYCDAALKANKLSIVFEDKEAARDTLDRVREFVTHHPTVYLSTHCPEGYENLALKRVMKL